MAQRTLVICKPDCVQRGLVTTVMQRFEMTGLRLVGAKVTRLSTEILEEHYGHLKEKPFFPNIVSYMQSAPVVISVREWPNAVAVVRKLIGVTNPVDAAPGTIRGDFALIIDANIVHASEDEAAAEAEIKRFFGQQEVVS